MPSLREEREKDYLMAYLTIAFASHPQSCLFFFLAVRAEAASSVWPA